MKRYPITVSLPQQQGIVLFLSLIILVLLTTLAISSMQMTILDEKMAGNTQNQQIALQSAESALQDSELWLSQQPTTPTPANARIWALDALDPTANNGISWWFEVGMPANATSFNTNGTVANVVIEQLAAQPAINMSGDNVSSTFFRITAEATGPDQQSRVLLQSSFVGGY
ncbi:MAG TPA: hypothetical protein DCR13_06045 [Gammaproteobacteria bacterium]|nr:hypothetical protein [Gammaproteobacteria bacterium]